MLEYTFLGGHTVPVYKLFNLQLPFSSRFPEFYQVQEVLGFGMLTSGWVVLLSMGCPGKEGSSTSASCLAAMFSLYYSASHYAEMRREELLHM